MTAPARPPRRLRTFVSYSRKDASITQRVHTHLEAHDIDVLRDTEDILPSEEWKNRLARLILESDTVVFVLSLRSATSDVCAWEASEAQKLNKRIVPFLIEDLGAATPPEVLARLQYIIATDAETKQLTETSMNAALATLVSTINTDIAWVREHTRIGELARRWADAPLGDRFLLRGQDISDAERWRDERPREAPALTEQQATFIAVSRRAASRRQRNLLLLSVGITVLTLALAIFAYYEMRTARTNARLAVSNEAVSLAELSRSYTAQGDTSRALQVGLRAFDMAAGETAGTQAAEQAMYQALWHHRETRQRRVETSLRNGWFAEDGSIIVVSDAALIKLDSTLDEISREPLTINDEDDPKSPRPPLHLPPQVPASIDPQRGVVSVTIGDQHWALPLAEFANDSSRPLGDWHVSAYRIDHDTTKNAIVCLHEKGTEPASDGTVCGTLALVSKADHESLPRVAWRSESSLPLSAVRGEGYLIAYGGFYTALNYIATSQPSSPVQVHPYVLGMYVPQIIAPCPRTELVAVTDSGQIDWEQPRILAALPGVTKATLGGHEGPAVAVDCSANGESVLTITVSGTVRLWSTHIAANHVLARLAGGTVMMPTEANASQPVTGFGEDDVVGGLEHHYFSASVVGSTRADYALPGNQLDMYEHVSKSFALTERDGRLTLWRRDRGRTFDIAHERARILDAIVVGTELYTAGSDGRLVRWNLDTGASSELWRNSSGPVHWLRLVRDDDRDVLLLGSETAVFELDLSAGARVPKRVVELPSPKHDDSAFFRSATVGTDERWLHLCMNERCYAMDRRTYKIVAAGPCMVPFQIDTELGIAYCPNSGDSVAEVRRLDNGSSLTRRMFRSKVVDQLEGLPAGISFQKLPGCKRAFVRITGGNPDVPFPGEGLLFDFDADREIVRDLGEVAVAYERFHDGDDLPAFCTAAQLASYVRALLAQVR